MVLIFREQQSPEAETLRRIKSCWQYSVSIDGILQQQGRTETLLLDVYCGNDSSEKPGFREAT